MNNFSKKSTLLLGGVMSFYAQSQTLIQKVLPSDKSRSGWFGGLALTVGILPWLWMQTLW
jgi:hypothetical protein